MYLNKLIFVYNIDHPLGLSERMSPSLLFSPFFRFNRPPEERAQVSTFLKRAQRALLTILFLDVIIIDEAAQ